MVHQRAAKTRSIMGAVGILAVVTLVRETFGPVAQRMEPDIVSLVEEVGQVSGNFEKLPLDSERDRDGIVLRNGDSLSGRVVGIRDGAVHFQADMAEGEIRAPVANLTSVFFRNSLQRGDATGTRVQPVSGEIALADGGRFGATILRMDGERLFFSLDSSPDSAKIALELDKIASVAFSREPLALLETDFSDTHSSPFTAGEGEWFVYDRRFLQSDPGQHNASAYARVQQQGLMRYSWTLHKSDWGHGGMCVLSSGQQPGEGGQGYRIHVEPNRLVLRKLQEGGESEGFWRPIPPGMTVARVEVLVNCPGRTVQIGLNGRQIAHLRDNGSPVQGGDFVVLMAMGRVAFDDIRVEHLGADATPGETDGGRDTLILKNGDKIVGTVTQILEDKIVVEGGFPFLLRPGRSAVKPLMVDRGRMVRIVFGGRTSSPATGPQVVFRDESRLEGSARLLENDVLEVENPVLGRVRFHASAVKCILF